MNPALNDTPRDPNAKKSRFNRSKHKRGPQGGRRPQAPIFDLEQLLQKAGPALWNAVHEAKVSEIKPEGVVVAIADTPGASAVSALIPTTELRAQVPEVGATLRVYLEDPPKNKGDATAIAKASLAKAEQFAQMQTLQEAMQKGDEVLGFVIGAIKGGFSVTLAAKSREEAEAGVGLRGFLPGRQSSLGQRDAKLMSDREPYLFKIKEFEPASGNIIVSRRDILLKEKRAAEKVFWENAKEGDVVSGVVRSIVPYGAFVDAGGFDGLLHITDMSWDKKPHLDVVQVGQTITVKILELDKKAKKLKLGLKQMTPDPWQSLQGQFRPGMDVEGTVVALADFGVFVHLADGIEGLVHMSELTWQRIKHPSQRYHIGDTVKARVLRLDQDGHRISLSTKALEQNPIEKLAEKFPAGAVLKTRIVGIKEYGVFVELEENVTGLVHVGELSWTKRVEHPNEMFEEGQEVEIVVLGFDPERQRVSCSIKRIQEDPWVKWKVQYAKGTRHEVTVKKVVNQGVECELEPGLLGFCSAKELSEEGASRAQDAAKVGQKLSVEVTQCDPVQQRIALSVKARIMKETNEDYQMYLQKQSQEGSSKTTLGEAFGDVKHKDEA